MSSGVPGVRASAWCMFARRQGVLLAKTLRQQPTLSGPGVLACTQCASRRTHDALRCPLPVSPARQGPGDRARCQEGGSAAPALPAVA